MLIISSINIPAEAIEQLEKYGTVLFFETHGLTYPAISCHPDVFMCQSDNQLIISPNTPAIFRNILRENKVQFLIGQSEVGISYPESAKYNAVITDHYLIHNLDITDKVIKDVSIDKKKIHVNQGYTRCNLLPIEHDSFITSDKGIYDTLTANELKVLLVNPDGILLSGFRNGFFGGVCGVHQNRIFSMGSLDELIDGKHVTSFIDHVGSKLIELYNGPLIDCGSLILID